MSWVRLDDGFDENPKQLSLSDGAFRVWVCSFTYCARQHPVTGFMTVTQAQGLARKLRKPVRVIAELVQARAWEPVRGGYLIHNYEQYVDRGSRQRTAEWRERKRHEVVTGDGDVTSHVGHGDEPVTSLARDGYPVPEPVPVLSPPTSDSDPPTPLPASDVTVTLTGAYLGEYEAFLVELNQATGRHFRGDSLSRSLYADRRRDGRSADELLSAARGVAKSRHHMGLNKLQVPLNDPKHVLESDMLDSLIGLGNGEIGIVREATREEQQQAGIREWAERKEAQRRGMEA